MALVVTTSAGTSGNPPWVHVAGTIQQVLDELQNQNVNAEKGIEWTTDSGNAIAVFCRS
jgi:hypothetical protein